LFVIKIIKNYLYLFLKNILKVYEINNIEMKKEMSVSFVKEKQYIG
jgi:hypothetical protein